MGDPVRIHLPCPHENCGSTDAASIYEKKDGTKDGHCFSCMQYIKPSLVEEFYHEGYEPKKENRLDEQEKNRILSLECRGWRERRVGKEVSELYRIRTEFDDKGNVLKRYYPVTEQGELTGYHVRDCVNKNFYTIGKNKTSSEFFGQALFSGGGKFLIICGGEEDAASVQQALKHKNPQYTTAVVSPTNGESTVAAQIKANFDWVTSFEKVTLMLDSDEAGKQATQKAVKLLKPGQGYVANLNLKDANEYIKIGRENDLVSAFWKAERFSPAGVIGSSQTWEALVERSKWEKVPLPPFAGDLSMMMAGGPALGEITTLAAASSIGKTSVVNEFLYYWAFNSPYRVGVISLESDVGELVENLMSLHISKKLPNLTDEEKLEYYKTEDAKEAHRKLTTMEDGTDRFIILDHQGDTIDEELKQKEEYLVRAMDCRLIILDPITLALSGKNNEGMDEFMAWLLRFVKANMVSQINVAHVRKSSSGGKANSTGADIHEEDIKGSGSGFQVSANNILLMRDKENADPVVRNTTKVVISKCRRTGKTGPAGWWYYNGETARLQKSSDPSSGDYSEDESLFDQSGAYNDTEPEEAGNKVKEPESF